MNTIDLGSTVLDTVTGFKGIVTQKISYLHATDRCGVEALDDKGKPKIEFFDIGRLSPV